MARRERWRDLHGFRRSPVTLRLVLSGVVAFGLGCEKDPAGPDLSVPTEAEGPSLALGMWTPGPSDTCSAALHDQYSTVGPDGLLYPTWHPPVDASTGCTFGHEHGRDPSGSDLFGEVGAIPFGYANQHLEASGFGASRSEDHVGHKIEWENDAPMRVGDGGAALFDITCDILVKIHQGTHSPDAFTNNMHEVAYHIRCSDGTGFSATLLTPIGDAGELVASCFRDRHHEAGTANPPNSPDGGGKRAIPDAACIEEEILRPEGERSRFGALRESWEISARLRSESGRTLASFNPYFQVMDPSRYYDPAAPGGLARPLDLCYREGPLRARGGPCDDIGAEPGVAPLAWDDPLSPFDGTRRFVDVNGNRVRNADGPEIWYTDPLGEGGRPEPFPGSLRQWIARHDNGALDLHGPVMGRDRDYDAPGIHAPN